MSMNVYVYGDREIFFKLPNGEMGTDVQRCRVQVQQTSTDTTNVIINSGNALEAYRDFVKDKIGKHVIQEPVYAEGDIFGEYPAIGFKPHDPYEEHLKEFDETVDNLVKNGYTIYVEQI